MNKDIKKQWVEALLSGRYKQGKRRLKNSYNEFCCLGVLCDISQLGSWGVDNSYLVVTRAHELLSEEVRLWAGLKSDNPRLSRRMTAAKLNDSGKSFQEIAKLIEENL